jgi:hypothetical protein
MKRTTNRALHSFTRDAESILDLFATGARPVSPGTLADDFRSAYRDFQEIGKDFESVLSHEESAGSLK